jgi:hypothetical protein
MINQQQGEVMTKFKPGMKVIADDDPEPGIVDHVEDGGKIVWVRFKVQGRYDHPNSLVDFDPRDLRIYLYQEES